MATADIPGELASLPLEFLISAPMSGAIKAQAQSAMQTVEFIKKVGFKQDNKQGGNNSQQQIQNIDFSYGGGSQSRGGTKSLSVPLLSIVPVPYIRIRDMHIDFEFKIHTFQEDKSEKGDQSHSDQNLTTGASSEWWEPVSFTANGTFNHSTDSHTLNNSTANVDRTARMAVQVTAVQDEMPAGLKTVLSILNNAIEGEIKNEGEAMKQQKPGGG